MPQYKLAARAEAARLEAEADAYSAKGRANVQQATNDVLAVVLFAVSLFFAGISTKLRARRLQIVLLSLGAAIALGAIVWLATQPINISV
jgi:predicted phage tail protein